MPKPNHCTPHHNNLKRIQPYTHILIAVTMTDGIKRPDLASQAEKGNSQISSII
jgi:hypothetical protein